MFKEVDTDLIPFDKRSRTSAYYDLSMPVVCRLNGNTISEVVFLNDIPISNGNNEEGFSFEINTDNRNNVLKYNNKPFIHDNITDKKDLQFAHLIEEYVGANKRIMTLNQIISFITPDRYRRSKEIITRPKGGTGFPIWPSEVKKAYSERKRKHGSYNRTFQKTY